MYIKPISTMTELNTNFKSMPHAPVMSIYQFCAIKMIPVLKIYIT